MGVLMRVGIVTGTVPKQIKSENAAVKATGRLFGQGDRM